MIMFEAPKINELVIKKPVILPPLNESEQSTSIKPVEIGGPAGPEPTRYGDWEVKGRCSDF